MIPDLSVLVASRNEAFLNRTVNDLLEHSELNTEVLVLLDGAWPVEPVPDNPKVTLIHRPKSIGQRAAVVELAKLSRAKFLAKCDAHVSVDQGYDRKLAEACDYNVTLIPRLYNLHCFNRKCNACSHEIYQGAIPEKCPACEKSEGFERVMVWQPRWHKRTDFARFSSDLVYGYWHDYEKRPEAQGDLCDTMSFLGAFWFQHRERFFELGALDLLHGGWGNLGTEVSLANQLSEDGALKVLKTTFYSHMFRTKQGPDWGFPYPLSGDDVAKARAHSRDLWTNGKFAKQAKPLSSVVEKYWPVPGWTDEALDSLKQIESSKWPASVLVSRPRVEAPAIIKRAQTAGIVYYTDALLADPILEACQRQLKRAANGHHIVNVSLGKAIDFGDENIILDRERGTKTLFLQILAGLERSTADYVFLCEHDCLMPKEHFEFVPPSETAFYYNSSMYRVSTVTGQAVTYQTKALSGLCANRLLLVEHYYRRLAKMSQATRELIARGARVKLDGHNRDAGWEPGNPPRHKHRIDDYPSETWASSVPYIDIRDTGSNFTPTRWTPAAFKDPATCLGWRELSEGEVIPGWGSPVGRFNEFLAEIAK